ncbi:hypothetical protein PDE_08457 [Penicillium oxalicum 114-2]|uniref:Uncharacterized protein n=1 Tax=Penicillium oxalicum (strain 114-2 / CGMCC 5302) TaxID=933388 RepID=S7ZRZ5_PENO1|nr:hypothetical protein PDE_08457 [Penicillium oxalicum 114-2]
MPEPAHEVTVVRGSIIICPGFEFRLERLTGILHALGKSPVHVFGTRFHGIGESVTILISETNEILFVPAHSGENVNRDIKCQMQRNWPLALGKPQYPARLLEPMTGPSASSAAAHRLDRDHRTQFRASQKDPRAGCAA